MSDEIETVRVVADVPGGFKVINKSDLTEADELFTDAPAKAPKTKRKTRASSDD